MNAAIVTHGGAMSPIEWNDGCLRAAQVGLLTIQKESSSLEGVVKAVVELENDGRFNAGTGSAIRLDGKTIEMDAAVMDSRGNLGSVINLRHIKNPVLVAREILRSPHHILAGEGAFRFAKKCGFTEYSHVSEQVKERYQELLKQLSSHTSINRLKELWNFEKPWKEVLPVDTVGAVARDASGHFAVATSTGGSGLMLQGRVGDTPLIGSGFFAGEQGAVAVTGYGEEIMKKLLAKTIYDFITSNHSPQDACRKGVELFPPDVLVGAIAITSNGVGVYSRNGMSHAILKT